MNKQILSGENGFEPDPGSREGLMYAEAGCWVVWCFVAGGWVPAGGAECTSNPTAWHLSSRGHIFGCLRDGMAGQDGIPKLL